MSRATKLLLMAVSLLACTLANCTGGPFPPQIPTASPLQASGQTPPPAATPSSSPRSISSPTAVAVPERPAQFERYAPLIVGYLNDTNGDQDALRAVLGDWGVLRHATDLLRVDVDDDAVGELLLVIINPSPEYGINAEGDLLVLDFQGKGYQVGYNAAGDSVLPDPALLEVDDLNQDSYSEIAYSSTSCGAHTCFTKVYIVSSGSGTYADLTAGGIEMAYVAPYFADWDSDGVAELIMHGGTIGSVGAGPQRERTEVYRWDGATYVLTETMWDYSDYIYFRVVDANQALLDGEYERAATLYRDAIDNRALDVWMDEGERDDLAAFSRYRLTLTYLMTGETSQAEAASQELITAQPENIYAQVVTVLWHAYQQKGELEAACQEVNDFAQLHPEAVQVLADYGYSNPTFTVAEVCPLELF